MEDKGFQSRSEGGTAAGQRRLKRQVTGRDHRWFAAVQHPFVPVTFGELVSLGAREAEESAEGIRFTASFPEIYGFHLSVKTVSRFWLIVDDFSVRSREELFRKTFRIPWELYLRPGLPIRTRAMVRRSAVRHEGETAETVSEAILKKLEASGVTRVVSSGADSSGAAEGGTGDTRAISGDETQAVGGVEIQAVSGVEIQAVEAVVIDNRCELRLDSTGEHLHKRGYRAHTEPAPVRETTAAAILLWAIGKIGMPALFLDPMCGSGTFPVEMWGLSRKVSLVTGRRFRFMDWPGFKERTWAFLVRKSGEERRVLSGQTPAGQGDQPGGVGRCPACPVIRGSDVSAKAIRSARANAASLGLEGDILLETGDFFRLSGEEISGSAAAGNDFGGETAIWCGDEAASGGEKNVRLLCLNPPYGKRLPVTAGRNPYEAIISHCRERFRGWRILMLVPREEKPAGLETRYDVESVPFTNGGIPLFALLLADKKPGR